jgi:hypothetical protein
MSADTSSAPPPFRAAYTAALRDYLHDGTEASLRVAYELGREAVRQQLSVLDLAVVHQETVRSLIAATDLTEIRRLTSEADDFFLESLSSFEMVQRGFKEARHAFLHERRQTVLSRQLSSFLADASLALDASGSLDEMLRLVAEQARELVDAECCVATLAAPGRPRAAEAISHPDGDKRWSAVVRWLDLSAIARLVRLSGDAMRIDGERLAVLPAFRSATSHRPLRGWLGASLTALDGSELGAIQLFDKHDGGFTEDDEGALVHLAQMASAAVERAQLYQERR